MSVKPGTVVGVVLILAGLALIASPSILPLTLVWLQPKYTSDAIILYDGNPSANMQFDSTSNMYAVEFAYQINFQSPYSEVQPQLQVKYYFVVEAYDVSAQVFWSLWFYQHSTGAIGSGVGAWITKGNEKFCGIERAGYYVIPWTWEKSGLDYMLLRFYSATKSFSGTIKVYIQWFVQPQATQVYTVELTKVHCEGLNKAILVEGKISPAVGSKEVRVKVTYPSGNTATRTALTLSDGTFALNNPNDPIASEVGTYTVQAFIDGTASEPKPLIVPEPAKKPPYKITLQSILGLALIVVGVVLVIRKR